jgi:hypothetical protein
MTKEYEYVTMVEVADSLPKTKTKIFHVRNRKSGDMLGSVQWYAPWRQYCFMVQPSPVKGFVFSRGSLEDIAGFVGGLMDERAGPTRRKEDDNG